MKGKGTRLRIGIHFPEATPELVSQDRGAGDLRVTKADEHRRILRSAQMGAGSNAGPHFSLGQCQDAAPTSIVSGCLIGVRLRLAPAKVASMPVAFLLGARETGGKTPVLFRLGRWQSSTIAALEVMPHGDSMPTIPDTRRHAARTGLSLLGATIVFFSALLGAVSTSQDITPLLTIPRPDLRVPLGLSGIAAGVAVAKWVAGLPHIRERAARWVFFVMLPLCLALGFASGGERLFEMYSFQSDVSAPHLAVLRVRDTSLTPGRRGRPDSYQAHLLSPFDDRKVDLIIDQSLFERLEPSRDCLTLLVERARNGAVRMVKIVGVTDRSPSCWG